MRLGPEHVGKVAADALARGYRHIKLHEHAVEAVAAARAAVGPSIPLMLDTNCHWSSVEDARAAALAMAPYDLAWLEEPLFPPDDFDALARLRREVRVPIARVKTSAMRSTSRGSPARARSTWCSQASPRWAASAKS